MSHIGAMSSFSLRFRGRIDSAASRDRARATEFRVLASLFVISALIAGPVAMVGLGCVHLLATRSFVGLALVLAAAFMVWASTYRFGRYSSTRIGRAMRWSRGHIAPLFLGAAWAADRPESWILSALGVVVLRVALRAFRRACRGEALPEGRLRVLCAGDAFPPKVDGVVTFSIQSLRYLRAAGHRAHVLTSVPGAETIEGAPVTRLPGFETPMSPDHFVTLPLPSVLALFSRFQPDVIQLFEASPLTLVMPLYAQIADIPVVTSHHTRLDCYADFVAPKLPSVLSRAILSILERTFYPIVDTHLAVNDVLLDRVRDCGGRDVRFWSSGVDEAFSPAHRSAAMRERLSGGRPDLPLILHVGRLAPEKCSGEIPSIIEEARAALGEGEARFAIVGEGILREELADGIGGDVRFTGALSGVELWEAYASSDVFFSPSTTESFPLVYLEAMRSGVVVIGPEAGGVPHCFIDGEGGFYFRPHDPVSAGEAIGRALAGLEALRAQALARGERFGWSKSMREFEDAIVESASLRRAA